MKKRFIATILIATLIIGTISGCGDSSQETVEIITQSEESIAEIDTETTDNEAEDTLETVTNNEYEQEEQGQNDETIDDESELAEEEFNEEQAFNKIAEMFNARNELFAQGSLSVDLNFLCAAEAYRKYQDIVAEGDIPLVTKDGIDCNEWGENFGGAPWLCTVTMSNYFYNYVNNNTGYYSIEKYVQERTFDEILNDLGIGKYENVDDTNSTLMMNAVSLIEYLLQNIGTLEYDELLEGDEITTKWIEVSGIPVYYQLPLLIDGEYSHLDAVYDEDGHLLNIVADEVADGDEKYRLNCADEITQLYYE